MRRYVKLYSTKKDGSRVIDHIQARMDQSLDEEWPEEFPLPEPPAALLDVWEWYWDLRSSATVGFAGPQALSYTEIQAWSGLMEIKIHPSKVRFLRMMDSEYLRIVAKDHKATPSQTQAHRHKPRRSRSR